MIINKTERFYPYYEIIDGCGCSIVKKEETKKEIKLKKKLNNEYNELVKNLPKKKDFKDTMRQAVKEIKSCYKLDTHMRISRELINSSSQPGDYSMIKNKAILSFYAMVIGAIDKNIDSAQNWIDFGERFNKPDSLEEIRKQKLLNLRETVVFDFNQEVNNLWIDSKIKEALSVYPTYNYFGELYQTLKYNNEISSDVINLCIAYNEGYSSGDLNPDDIRSLYNNEKAKLLTEKSINEGEYQKAIQRIRK